MHSAEPPEAGSSMRSGSDSSNTTTPSISALGQGFDAVKNEEQERDTGLGGVADSSLSPSDKDKDPVETADKSCTRCRERKVRCDRVWPTCKRCTKRKERCAYPPGVTLETVEQLNDAQKIERLEKKLAELETQLHMAHNQPHQSQRSPSTLNFPSSETPSVLQMHSDALPPIPPSPLTLPEMIYVAVTKDTDLANVSAIYYFLAEALEMRRKGRRRSLARGPSDQFRLGDVNLDWKLGRKELSRELRRVLVGESRKACCSRVPAFATLKARIDSIEAQMERYKLRKRNHEDADDQDDDETDDTVLAGLDASTKIAVVVLCCLGARSSQHSAVLGVPCDKSSPSEVMLSAGKRRQKACHELANLTLDMCHKSGLMVQGEPEWEREGLEGLCGVVQLFLYADVRPRRARYVLRNAISVYLDLRDSPGMRRDKPKWDDMKHSLGHYLYECDAIISAQLSLPPLVPTTSAADFFVGSPNATFRLPDLINSSLSSDLGKILTTENGTRALLTKQLISECLWAAAAWVCSISREFAFYSTYRSDTAPSPLPNMVALWRSLDTLHTTIQQLQQVLVSINYIPAGCASAEEVQDFILLGVRMDTRVIDLVGLIDGFLRDYTQEDERIVGMRVESELRLRKCLKLLAFYAKLYLDSRDPHVVYHLFMQASLISNWTVLCMQRVGDPGGPPSAEFEVSEQELTWLRNALELACFYCPSAGDKLKELTGEVPPVDTKESTSWVATPSTLIPIRRLEPGFVASPAPLHRPVSTGPSSTHPQHSASAPLPNRNAAEERRHYGLPAPYHSYSAPQASTPSSVSHYQQSQYALPPLPTYEVPAGVGEVYGHFGGQNWMDYALEDLENATREAEDQGAGVQRESFHGY